MVFLATVRPDLLAQRSGQDSARQETNSDWLSGHFGVASIDAAELKLRAERRLGGTAGQRRGAARWSIEVARWNFDEGGAVHLPDGINKHQSHRWQRMAAAPEREFTKEIAKAREQQEKTKTAGITII